MNYRTFETMGDYFRGKKTNKEVYRLFKILLLEADHLLLHHIRMTGSHFTSNSLSRTVYNSMATLSLLRSFSIPSTTRFFSTALSPYIFLGCYTMTQFCVFLWMPAILLAGCQQAE